MNIKSSPWRRSQNDNVPNMSEIKMEQAEKYRTGNTAVDMEEFYRDSLPVKVVRRSDYL